MGILAKDWETNFLSSSLFLSRLENVELTGFLHNSFEMEKWNPRTKNMKWKNLFMRANKSEKEKYKQLAMNTTRTDQENF